MTSHPPCGLTEAHTRLTDTAADAPTGLCVPAAATDSTSILLAWNKPEAPGRTVVDHEVLMDGRVLGLVSDNARAHTPAQAYLDGFARDDAGRHPGGFHVGVLPHTFAVRGLQPSSEYTFTVRAVFDDGSRSAPSEPVVVATPPSPRRIVVTEYGAVGDGTAVDTAAIQAAIDACAEPRGGPSGAPGGPSGAPGGPNDAPGGHVVIPAGTFLSGALFLHGGMTLEFEAGARLLGSPRWQDYPIEQGYYLYAVPDPVPGEAAPTQYLRPPSLLNVIPTRHARSEADRRPGAAERGVRIVGQGVIDGNGWKRTASGTTLDELGHTLPDYRASSAQDVGCDGILAADQTAHARAVADSLPGIVNRPEHIPEDKLYGEYRSSLVTLIGVDGIFISGIGVENPAMHGLMFLDCDDVTVYGTRHTTFNANNGDGLEFGGAQRALVAGNFFDTGDDVVNFAAGQGRHGALGRPSQDVWIQGNYIRRGHGGIAIGSHTAARVQHILAEDNVFHLTEKGAFRMKSTSDMAGGARDIVFRDSAVSGMKTNAVIASLSYSQSPSGYVPANSARFERIVVENVSIEGGGPWSEGPDAEPVAPWLLVQAGPAVAADTVGPMRLSGIRVIGSAPGDVQGLVDSEFRDIRFEDGSGDREPVHLDAASTGNTWNNVLHRGEDGAWKTFTP